MIELDRDAPLPIGDQLVDALRYEISAGRYRPGERLPSTRALADQVSISFHTVRKAYQRLAEEGAVEVRRGGGYFVAERPGLSRAERLERAASVVHDTLHKLVGLGLSEDEVEYAVHEGLQFFERPGASRSLVFAAAYRELAEAGAELATGALQERVVPVLLADLGRHVGADGAIVPLPDVRVALQTLPSVETVGVIVEWPHEILDKVSRFVPPDALGLVTRLPDAVGPVSDEIRRLTGFAGRIEGVPVEADRTAVEAVVRRSDFVLYTPGARRRLRPALQRLGRASAEWAPSFSAESLVRLRRSLAV